MKEQVLKNCLFDVNCLNGIINVRLGKKKDINVENFLKKSDLKNFGISV